MHCLVDMSLVSYTHTPQERIEYITTFVLPTLAALKELEKQGVVVAGGIKSGEVGIALILKVDSLKQLDEIIERLPLRPRMATKVTPLVSFEAHESGVKQRLEVI